MTLTDGERAGTRGHLLAIAAGTERHPVKLTLPVTGDTAELTVCLPARLEVRFTRNGKVVTGFKAFAKSLEQQLGQRLPNSGNGHHAPTRPQGNSNPPRNGNGRSQAGVSDKQMKFIKSLIGELKSLGCDYPFVEALCRRQFQRGLDHLHRAQASTLIGHLSEVKAGRVTVQQLEA